MNVLMMGKGNRVENCKILEKNKLNKKRIVSRSLHDCTVFSSFILASVWGLPLTRQVNVY